MPRRTLLTWQFAWFVTIMTRDEWLRSTACTQVSLRPCNLLRPFSNALLLDKPITHLFQEQCLGLFVFRPVHVKDAGLDLALYDLSHKVIATMIMKASGKIWPLPTRNLDAQSSPRHVLAHDFRQHTLMTFGLDNQIASHD